MPSGASPQCSPLTARLSQRNTPGRSAGGASYADCLVRVAVVDRGRGRAALFGRLLHDRGLGREDHPRHRRCVEHRRASHLHRVDDAVGEQVAVFERRRVEALSCGQLATPCSPRPSRPARRWWRSSTAARTARRRTRRRRPPDHPSATRAATSAPSRPAPVRAATGDDALLDGRLGCRHRVLDGFLALLQVGLGGRADLDDRDAAGQLGQPLLELLAVPVGVRRLDLGAQLRLAALDGVLACRRRRRSRCCPC